MSEFKPTLVYDGLPLLDTQFGLKPQEMNLYSDELQEAILCALDLHMTEVSNESRRALSNLITLARTIGLSA